MKKIVLIISFATTLITSCTKQGTQSEAANKQNTTQAITTLAPPTVGQQHNLVLEAYEEQHGFPFSATTLTYAQVETIMHNVNQICIDQGILTNIDVNTATENTMSEFENLGLFNVNNALKSKSDILDILQNAMPNTTIKAAQVNIRAYSGSNFPGYVNSELDGLLTSSALNASEVIMIEGSKDIFNYSDSFWGGYVTANEFQRIADEWGFNYGFYSAKSAGLIDGLATATGIYYAAKFSAIAGYYS